MEETSGAHPSSPPSAVTRAINSSAASPIPPKARGRRRVWCPYVMTYVSPARMLPDCRRPGIDQDQTSRSCQAPNFHSLLTIWLCRHMSVRLGRRPANDALLMVQLVPAAAPGGLPCGAGWARLSSMARSGVTDRAMQPRLSAIVANCARDVTCSRAKMPKCCKNAVWPTICNLDHGPSVQKPMPAFGPHGATGHGAQASGEAGGFNRRAR